MASNIASTEIDALLAADEDAALVLEPENSFIPASFKTVLSHLEIVSVLTTLKGFWKLSNNCLALPLIVLVLLMYSVRSVNGHSSASGTYCSTVNGSRCFPGLDVFNKLLK